MSKKNNPYDISKLKNRNSDKSKRSNIEKYNPKLSFSNNNLDDNKSVISVDITEEKPYKYKKKIYSAKEIEEKLENYISIEPKLWSRLERPEYIRYFKSKPNDPPFSIEEYKDVFNVGGFLVTIKTIQNEDGTEKKYLILSRNPPPSKNTWMINFNTIKKLYRKRNDIIKPEMTEFATKVQDYQQVADKNQNILQNSIIKTKQDIISMKEDINIIKEQIIKQKDDLEDMVDFIKKKFDI